MVSDAVGGECGVATAAALVLGDPSAQLVAAGIEAEDALVELGRAEEPFPERAARTSQRSGFPEQELIAAVAGGLQSRGHRTEEVSVLDRRRGNDVAVDSLALRVEPVALVGLVPGRPAMHLREVLARCLHELLVIRSARLAVMGVRLARICPARSLNRREDYLEAAGLRLVDQLVVLEPGAGRIGGGVGGVEPRGLRLRVGVRRYAAPEEQRMDRGRAERLDLVERLLALGVARRDQRGIVLEDRLLACGGVRGRCRNGGREDGTYGESYQQRLEH